MSNVTSIAGSLEARAVAQDFHQAATAGGFRYRVDGRIVRISHTFEPGDTKGFLRLDCEATALLYTLPSKSPVYGVDGAGGMIALEKGHGTVQVPGVNAQVVRELTRLLDDEDAAKPPEGSIAAALRTAMPERYGR